MLGDFDIEAGVDPLLDWFMNHARILPWRTDAAPYRVWISEIMLQQTRVEAVKPYFERFVKELPDILSLALCPEDKLLKLWEGLGYYNRARNLKSAAQQIMEQYNGEMPSDYEELLKLKGIGHYTAGAIASIAYGKRTPAVDGNVLRVITRLTGDSTDIMRQSFRNKVEEAIGAVMPDGRCGAFNQALMELGAIVCVPNGEPECSKCPWETICTAHKEGSEVEYPIKKKPKERRIEEKTILVIRDGEKVVLQKRPAKGLLAGMYEFPAKDGHLTKEEALEISKKMGFLPLRIRCLPEAKHVFSHVEWHMSAYLINVSELADAPKGLLLAERTQVERDFAVPAAYGTYMRAIHFAEN